MLTSEYFSQYIRHARVNDAQIFLLNIRFWNQVILVGKRTFLMFISRSDILPGIGSNPPNWALYTTQ